MNRLSAAESPIVLIVVLLLMPAVSVLAQETDEEQLAAIVHAIEIGWEKADGRPFRKHFLDSESARYIEGGGQNVGLTDLIEHHVEPEGDALSSLDLSFSNIETHIEGEFAWAISDVEVKATIRGTGRTIHNAGYETFVFRKVDGHWKVLHTHSSSRPVKSEESHDERSDHH